MHPGAHPEKNKMSMKEKMMELVTVMTQGLQRCKAIMAIITLAKAMAIVGAGRPTHRDLMPLNPLLLVLPFEKWGIDFVGPIKPASHPSCCRYILVCMDYVTKWAEAEALTEDTAKVATFLYKNIIMRFGCPLELVSDRDTHFINQVIETLVEKYGIAHRYHPRAWCAPTRYV
ncbi:uncharacterized protein LOC112342879 [Selaginella moellendorffii]|uniref:uncharacterized protein LOC112342879 n=1 Tax=Selaginella moellendorffii TaxID=88036 RepID=UPI000D1C4E4C|nr:uncharacterized protein LOC112342879 [Selaginella moellendorffii]|eukprot:XP_024521221.1 uncharacterized protein LOC112342879 [Selaginella moellendorffii]